MRRSEPRSGDTLLPDNDSCRPYGTRPLNLRLPSAEALGYALSSRKRDSIVPGSYIAFNNLEPYRASYIAFNNLEQYRAS